MPNTRVSDSETTKPVAPQSTPAPAQPIQGDTKPADKPAVAT